MQISSEPWLQSKHPNLLIDKKDNMTPQAEFREGLDELAVHYKEVLKLLGEDPTREGLEKTPIRVAKAMQVLTRGYTQDPKKVLTDALFEEKKSMSLTMTI